MKTKTIKARDLEISLAKRTLNEDKENNTYIVTLKLNFAPELICHDIFYKRIVSEKALVVTRLAKLKEKDFIEIEDTFNTDNINLDNILNTDTSELYNYLDEVTIEELHRFIIHSYGGSMSHSLSEPLKLYFNNYTPKHTEDPTPEPNVVEPVKREMKYPLQVATEKELDEFGCDYKKMKVENIKTHFSNRLLELYPSGLSLFKDESNRKEYELYSCLLDMIQNANNITDVMNISAKYDVDLYRQTYGNYRDMQYLCTKFNAIYLQLLIINKYNGNFITLKEATRLTGKTLEYYMTGYISAYNINTINRINAHLGGREYLIMY